MGVVLVPSLDGVDRSSPAAASTTSSVPSGPSASTVSAAAATGVAADRIIDVDIAVQDLGVTVCILPEKKQQSKN